MLRAEVNDVFGHFHKGSNRKNKSEINRTIWKLPKSKEAFDAISLSIWWVLGGLPGNKERLTHRQKILATRFATTNFSHQELMKVIKNTESNVWNIIKGLFEKMEDPMLFEHFLVDFLSRNKHQNGMSYMLKWDRTLDDNLATDFTFCMNDPTGKPVIFWTQLTTTNCRNKQMKRDKMIALRNRQERRQIDEIIEQMSPRVRPDVLLIITANGKISEQIRSQKTPFKDAYIGWKNEWYTAWWPTRFLDNDIQTAFELINYFLPQMAEYFFVWHANNFSSITSNFNSITSQDISFQKKKYTIKLDYKHEEDIFSVSLFENREWGEKFVFSTDFTQSRFQK